MRQRNHVRPAIQVWLALGIVALTGQQKPADCRTPLGIPCSTIMYESSQWQMGTSLTQPYLHHVSRRTVGNRSDGSLVIIPDGLYTQLYEASSAEVIRIDVRAKTISHRPVIMWHDRPFRQSSDSDVSCAGTIRHFGNDFHLTGESSVTGITVRRWERGNGWFWHEEQDLAPSLDCTVLKSYTIRRNHLLIPTSIDSTEASFVRLGEPDSGLFAVPAGYREVKDPSEEGLRQFARMNGSGL